MVFSFRKAPVRSTPRRQSLSSKARRHFGGIKLFLTVQSLSIHDITPPVPKAILKAV